MDSSATGTDLRMDGLAALRAPFTPNQIGKLPKPYNKDSLKGNCRECGGYHGLPAMHLDYVGHAALTDRFLDVDPEWSWEPFAVGPDGLPVLDRNGGLWIRLTVLGVTRIGYGDAQGKSGGDAVKEAIGDALRNAGMRFGAALDLWHKGDLHETDEPRTDPEPTPPPVEKSPADVARDELRAVLREKHISAKDVAARFQENEGISLRQCTNAELIQLYVDEYNAAEQEAKE